MGLAIVFLSMFAILLIFIGICFFSSVIFFIIAIIRKKKGKSYKGFQITGIVCIIPIVLMIIYGEVKNKKDEINTNNLLSYQLFHGNYDKAEELIENGVSPDSALYENRIAKDGEHTILISLCAKNYLYNPKFEGLVNENNRKEFITFLLDHGADPDKEIYLHARGYEEHSYEGASWRKRSDRCGCTPLMYAIMCGDLDTAELLIEKGADVNAIDYCGYNAAAIVVSELRKDDAKQFLELLNKNGCDMNVMTNYQLTTKEMYENRFGTDYPY